MEPFFRKSKHQAQVSHEDVCRMNAYQLNLTRLMLYPEADDHVTTISIHYILNEIRRTEQFLKQRTA